MKIMRRAQAIGAIAVLSVALFNIEPAAARSANWLVLCGQKDSLTVQSSPQSRKDFVQFNITLVNEGRYAFTFRARRDFRVFTYKRTETARGWSPWRRISNGDRPDRRSSRYIYFIRNAKLDFIRNAKLDNRGLQYLYQIIPVNKGRPPGRQRVREFAPLQEIHETAASVGAAGRPAADPLSGRQAPGLFHRRIWAWPG